MAAAAREGNLQAFLDAASSAFDAFAGGGEARGSIAQIFAALARPAPVRAGEGSRLPVCVHLDAAIGVDVSDPVLRRMLDSFRALEPALEWRRREAYDHTASANFAEGHANAMIVGPGGLERRHDVWLGATLMAPQVRYPDHDHAPEEVYLVASKGAFRQGDGDWFSPGVGGSFYNPPAIRHAMRSLDAPFLAFWALRAAA